DKARKVVESEKAICDEDEDGRPNEERMMAIKDLSRLDSRKIIKRTPKFPVFNSKLI
ncbi:hypothetical protein PanWU01x14_038560, partial [Parasponia andersonii]